MKKNLIISLISIYACLSLAGCSNTHAKPTRDFDSVKEEALTNPVEIVPLSHTEIDSSLIKEGLFVGETPIEEFSICYRDTTCMEAADTLSFYIEQISGHKLNSFLGGDNIGITNGIVLYIEPELGNERIVSAQNGFIYLGAGTEESLLTNVYSFANTYLGWAFAGTEDEHITAVANTLHIPDTIDDYSTAWIGEREATILLWSHFRPGGTSINNSVSFKTDIMSFSDDQLYEYVKMLKQCGYNGIQVTDICSAWGASGGKDNVQCSIRKLADAAHSMDMHFTLWVWGAQFTLYGYADPTVNYITSYDIPVTQDPVVNETFDKYYTEYAKLADVCDRVIGHFFDPGSLGTTDDVAYYAKRLKDKFTAVNPDIDFGISCWVDLWEKEKFTAVFGNDITLYEGLHQDDPTKYLGVRNFAKENGCRIGTWGWYNTEMESDQIPNMMYNGHEIQETYLAAKKYDSIIHSDYWSEMDAYHILNSYTMFAAAHLLCEPTQDVDALTYQAAYYSVGPEYADTFTEILKLIEDARTGYTYDSFFISQSDYILTSDSYPARSIYDRVNDLIPKLDEMIKAAPEGYYMSYPIPLSDILQLIKPHLLQIRAFAEFRLNLDDILASITDSTSGEEIYNLLDSIYTPIPEYNTLVGMWGQAEALAQRTLLNKICSQYGIETPSDPVYHNRLKERIYNSMAFAQKGNKEPVGVSSTGFFARALDSDGLKIVDELINDGLVIKNDDSYIYLTNWSDYIYSFDF